MARSRPKPRRRREPVKSRLAPCVYTPDPTLPDPVDPDTFLCGTPGCGLRRQHQRHQLPDTHAADAEHRRRIGDDG